MNLANYFFCVQDGSTAALQHVKKGLKNRVNEIPDKIPSTEAILSSSKDIIVKGKKVIVKYVSQIL